MSVLTSNLPLSGNPIKISQAILDQGISGGTAQNDMNSSGFRTALGLSGRASGSQISMGEGFVYDSVTTPGGQNLLTAGYSVNFGIWGNAYCNITPNASTVVNQDGTPASYIYGQGSGTPYGLIYTDISLGVAGPYYCSVYAKANTSAIMTLNCWTDGNSEVNTDFDLTLRTTAFNIGAGIYMEYCGFGWYRCIQLIAANASNLIHFRIWPGQRVGPGNTIGTYLWGAQINTRSVQNFLQV